MRLAVLNRALELNSAQSKSALDSALIAPLNFLAPPTLLAAAYDLALLSGVARILDGATLVYVTCVMSVTSTS